MWSRGPGLNTVRPEPFGRRLRRSLRTGQGRRAFSADRTPFDYALRASLRTSGILAAFLALSACRAEAPEPHFPKAERDVAPIVSDAFSTEDARDRLGEAEQVMALAGVRAGMSVADVGAGEGYYTVRLFFATFFRSNLKARFTAKVNTKSNEFYFVLKHLIKL